MCPFMCCATFPTLFRYGDQALADFILAEIFPFASCMSDDVKDFLGKGELLYY
jgi:hypothetical protein